MRPGRRFPISRRNQAAAGGFTLLEVMVAMVLLGIAMSLVMGGFRFTSKAWRSGEETTTRTSDLQVVQRVLHNMVGKSFPATVEDGRIIRYAFIGDEKQIRFTTFLPPYPDRAGLYTIELTIEQQNKLTQLLLRRAPFDEESFLLGELGDEQETLLLETPSRLAFSYFGAVDDNSDPDWHNQWDAPDQIPQTVRLAVDAGDEQEFDWPDIVTRIEVNIDNSCVFPQLGGKCRTSDLQGDGADGDAIGDEGLE